MTIETKFNIKDKVCYLADYFTLDGEKVQKWTASQVYAIQINYGNVIRYLTDNGWYEEDELRMSGRDLTEEEIDGGV